jgi:hypothetical protein
MTTPSTRRVRRDHAGGKRPEGLRLQRDQRAIRRPDPRRIATGPTDSALTGVAGLVRFGGYLRDSGLDSALARSFRRLKTGAGVVYPMDAQLRLLLDAAVVGEERIFGLEALAGDPLFTQLAGGTVPSIDTVYRDLARFDDAAVQDLELLLAKYGVAALKRRSFEVVHIDIDTSVEQLFGTQEGAKPGPNPRYRGRPSYHPIFAYVGETKSFVGALLRPGDTAFGADEIPFVTKIIRRVREAVGKECRIYVRIDAAGDCTALLRAIEAEGAHFLVKAKLTADLCDAMRSISRWTTTQVDGVEPTEQWADVGFARNEWRRHDFYPRVVGVRSKERLTGKQRGLWEDLEWTAHAFISSERVEPGDELARRYDARAGIEPEIGELKGAWGIGKVPTGSMRANHALFLLKLLACNLLRSFVAAVHRALLTWRAPWIRRVLITIPGRLVRSGRRWQLRVQPASLLAAPSG